MYLSQKVYLFMLQIATQPSPTVVEKMAEKLFKEEALHTFTHTHGEKSNRRSVIERSRDFLPAHPSNSYKYAKRTLDIFVNIVYTCVRKGDHDGGDQTATRT